MNSAIPLAIAAAGLAIALTVPLIDAEIQEKHYRDLREEACDSTRITSILQGRGWGGEESWKQCERDFDRDVCDLSHRIPGRGFIPTNCPELLGKVR